MAQFKVRYSRYPGHDEVTRYLHSPLPSQDNASASEHQPTPDLPAGPTNQPTHHDTSPSVSRIERIDHSGGQASQPTPDPLSPQMLPRPTPYVQVLFRFVTYDEVIKFSTVLCPRGRRSIQADIDQPLHRPLRSRAYLRAHSPVEASS